MQTTNLILSKKLKELGVKIDSEYLWYSEKSIKNEDGKWERGQWKLIQKQKGYISEFATEWGYKKYIPAPIAEELGELLPSYLTIEGEIWFLRIIKNPDEWGIYYEDNRHAGYIGTEGGGGILKESLTNAMASMVIYLKEQALI
jgi:hypothetical protein